MEVLDGQQFAFAPLDPLGARCVLALRAMAIAARVVADALMATVAAALHMPAQGGGPAGFNGPHHPQLIQRQAAALPVPGPMTAEDVGHFQRWAGQTSARRFRFGFGRPAAFFAGRRGGWAIERARHPAQRLRRDLDIAAGGLDRTVSEQGLNHAGIGAVFEQMGGETVAQGFLILLMVWYRPERSGIVFILSITSKLK
jgi:hypothetical protein